MKHTKNIAKTLILTLLLLGDIASLHAQTQQLTGSWAAFDKVFDNTTAAVVTFTPTNDGGSDVSVTASATFSSANVGGPQTVTVEQASIALSGTDASSFTVPDAPQAGTLTATIEPFDISNKNYDTPTSGSPEVFTPTQEGYYCLQVWGGQGEDGTGANSPGGKGGHAYGFVYLKTSDQLFVHVGDRGQATDIRLNVDDLYHRLIVGGGGGQGGSADNKPGGNGGATGANGNGGTTGGTQSAGGTGDVAGAFGTGGVGSAAKGGDGWYGGGGDNTGGDSGAGGSNWLYTANAYSNWTGTEKNSWGISEDYFVHTASNNNYANSAAIPGPFGSPTTNNNGNEPGQGHSGTGYARISRMGVTTLATPTYNGTSSVYPGVTKATYAKNPSTGAVVAITTAYSTAGTNTTTAGVNTATLTLTGTGNFTGTYTTPYTILQRQLSATWTVKKKVIGTANNDAVITHTLSNRVTGDDVDIVSGNYEGIFDDINSIGRTSITLSSPADGVPFTLTGAHKDNYLPPIRPTALGTGPGQIQGIVASLTFTGANNTTTNWSTPKNWETAAGQSSNADITPPLSRSDSDDVPLNITIQKDCVQDRAVDAVSITVEAGASYTVDAGMTLTTDDFTLMDNASFLCNGAANITTAHVKHTLEKGRNWYVGSPMQGGTTAPTAGASFGKQAGGTDVTSGRIHCWDDTAYDWQQIGTSEELTTGLGYTAYSESEDIEATFSGRFTDGDQQSPTLYRTEGRLKPGYNLVANPFPSYWKWTATAAAQAGAKPTIWYRTVESPGAYRFYTYNAASGVFAPGTNHPKDYVPPMQAFWVQLNEHVTGSSFTFANANRRHAEGGNNTLKSARADDGRTLLRLVVTDAGGRDCDEAVVYADPAAQSAFDNYDSEKMMNGTGGELYSLPPAGAEHLVINGLPAIGDRTAVTLGFVSDRAAGYTLRAVDFTAADRLTVDLYDLRSGHVETNWQANAGGYRFAAAAKDDPARFRLVFRNSGATGTLHAPHAAVNVYADHARLRVENAQGAELTVYTLAGYLLGRYRIDTPVWTAPQTFGRGAYLVRINEKGFKVLF